jgi:hypothetical protein
MTERVVWLNDSPEGDRGLTERQVAPAQREDAERSPDPRPSPGATVRRRLLTIHPPMTVALVAKILLDISDHYPDATMSSGETYDVWVTELLADVPAVGWWVTDGSTEGEPPGEG